MFVYLLYILLSVYVKCDALMTDNSLFNHPKPQQWKKDKFFYVTTGTSALMYNKKNARRFDGQACDICFGSEEGDDCIFIEDIDRCYYYDESEKIMVVNEKISDSKPALKLAVDTMMYSLMIKVSAERKWDECVPLISEYTNCNKDNICTGCQVCNCNDIGKWICKDVYKCFQDDSTKIVTHEMLVRAIDILEKDNNNARKKRDAEPTVVGPEAPSKAVNNVLTTQKPKQTYQPVSFIKNDKKTTTETLVLDLLPKANLKAENTQQTKDSLGNNIETIDFTDLLTNFGPQNDENKKFNLTHKPTLFDQHEIIYLLQELESATQINDNPLTSPISATDSKLKNIENSISLDKLKTNVDVVLNNFINLENKKMMKRDILNATDTPKFQNSSTVVTTTLPTVKITTEATTQITTTTIVAEKKEKTLIPSIHSEVLTPLKYIIDEKKTEIEQLNKIRENLQKYIENYSPYESNKSAISNNTVLYNNTLSLYKIDMSPDYLENVSRRSNLKFIERLLLRLKQNIYGVLRDIITIQKNSNKPLPVELKFLFNTLKRYMSMEKAENNRDSKKNNQMHNLLRKHSINETQKCFIKGRLAKILEIINKDTTESKTLVYLSKTTHKVINRLLKFMFKEDEKQKNKIDAEINLTDQLQMFGLKSTIIADQLKRAKINEWAYKLRLACLSISFDIEGVRLYLHNNNLKQFRRSFPRQKTSNEFVVKIQSDIVNLSNRIGAFLRSLRGGSNFRSTKIEVTNQNTSFLLRLKNVLQKSKNGIMRLIGQQNNDMKNPQTYSNSPPSLQQNNVMKNWQDTFNLRLHNIQKRSAVFNDRYKNKIKNILPKYLRGKVSLAHSNNMKHGRSLGKLDNKNNNIIRSNNTILNQNFQNRQDINAKKPIISHYLINNIVQVKPVNSKMKKETKHLTGSKTVSRVITTNKSIIRKDQLGSIKVKTDHKIKNTRNVTKNKTNKE